MARQRPPWMPAKPPTKREETRQLIEDCLRQARYVVELLDRGDHAAAARNEQLTLQAWLTRLQELTGGKP